MEDKMTEVISLPGLLSGEMEVKADSPAEKSDKETQEQNELSLHQQMEQEILDRVLKSYRKARPYGERKPITKKEKQKKKAKRRMVKKSKAKR